MCSAQVGRIYATCEDHSSTFRRCSETPSYYKILNKGKMTRNKIVPIPFQQYVDIMAKASQQRYKDNIFRYEDID